MTSWTTYNARRATSACVDCGSRIALRSIRCWLCYLRKRAGKTRAQTCAACGNAGHNALTCTERAA